MDIAKVHNEGQTTPIRIKHKGLLYKIKFDGDLLKWESTWLLKLISLGWFSGGFEIPANVICNYQITYRFPCYQLLMIRLIRSTHYAVRPEKKRNKVIILDGLNVLWLRPKVKRQVRALLDLYKKKNEDAHLIGVQWHIPVDKAEEGQWA